MTDRAVVTAREFLQNSDCISMLEYGLHIYARVRTAHRTESIDCISMLEYGLHIGLRVQLHIGLRVQTAYLC